jgi:hypothetical protein
MRPPSRIRPTLAAIAEVWSRHPDLRLGQFLENAAHLARGDRPGPDLFQMEEEQLLRGLKAFDERDATPPTRGPHA